MRLPLAAKKLMGSNTYADVSFWKIFFTNLKTIQIFIKWESKEGGRSLTVCPPPPRSWFSLNNSKAVKAVTLKF